MDDETRVSQYGSDSETGTNCSEIIFLELVKVNFTILTIIVKVVDGVRFAARAACRESV